MALIRHFVVGYYPVHRSVRIVKRAIDVIGSSVGLAVTLPLYPVIAAAIYLESPGPIFYPADTRRPSNCRRPRGCRPARATAHRIARSSRQFKMLKFRSMRPDAEKLYGAGARDRERSAHHARRAHPAQDPPRRAAAVRQRAPRRDEHRRPAAGAPRARRAARDGDPVLRGADARRQAGHHRPRPDLARRTRASRSPTATLAKFEADLTNPFKVEGAEDALADHMRVKLLYDLAYSATTENIWHFLPRRAGASSSRRRS